LPPQVEPDPAEAAGAMVLRWRTPANPPMPTALREIRGDQAGAV